MDLKDFEKSTAKKKFEALNKRLKQQFGVSINESSTTTDLRSLLKVTNETIHNAKMNGKAINSDPELARSILMKEAIISRMGELSHQDGLSKQEKIYNEIVDGLANYVNQCMELGDTFDEALSSAMREYRSSPYRFSDQSVQDDVSIRANQESNTFNMDDTMKNKDIRESFVSDLRALLESEVEEAEIVIATKGFSKSLQEMIEKVGRLQNEDLPPLSDQMRANYNIDVAHNFHEKTQGTLQSVLDSLYYAKDEIDRVVQNMATGNLHWENDMEADSEELEGEVEPELDSELDVGQEVGDIDSELADLEDELDDEPLGRIKKESLESIRNRLSVLKEQVEKAKAKKTKARK